MPRLEAAAMNSFSKSALDGMVKGTFIRERTAARGRACFKEQAREVSIKKHAAQCLGCAVAQNGTQEAGIRGAGE